MIDYIASAHQLGPIEFSHLGLVCLRLASKISEPAGGVIPYKWLSRYSRDQSLDYSALELRVLDRLDFNLNFRSPHSYLTLFTEDARLYAQIKSSRLPGFVSWMSKLAFECSLEYELNRFSSLAVAASIVMAARHAFGCESVLPGFLEALSGCTAKALKPCYGQVGALVKKLTKRGRLVTNYRGCCW